MTFIKLQSRSSYLPVGALKMTMKIDNFTTPLKTRPGSRSIFGSVSTIEVSVIGGNEYNFYVITFSVSGVISH